MSEYIPGRIFESIYRWDKKPLTNIRIWAKNVRWFFERGRYGVAPSDVWGFDHYLGTVIVRGMRQLRENHHGIPLDIANEVAETLGIEPDDNYEYPDVVWKTAADTWQNIMGLIVRGFEARLELDDIIIPTNDAREEELERRSRVGFVLLEKHWGSLWD